MAPTIQLVPMNELGIETLGPAPRRRPEPAGEDAAPHRELDAASIALADDPRVLEIDSRRGRRRVRQPVEGDVVEHLVAAEHRLRITLAVGPGVELLVDPGGLPDRRIRQGVADGLRPR